MIKSIKKLIALGIIATSICLLPITGASAEWKQNSTGWWNAEGSSYSIGWKEIDGKWYYFDNNGYMVTNTEINGYKIDNSGVWVQNTISNSNNNTTNIENTATTNSNNMTNLTNNTDNSIKNDANITLNNTGVINANTTNNVSVKIEQDNSYEKQLAKIQKDNDKEMNAYYQLKLDNAKVDLANAKSLLDKIKSQETIYNYTKLADGTYGYKYGYDIKAYDKQAKIVEKCRQQVDYYSKLIK